jgi:hypothetical protein
MRIIFKQQIDTIYYKIFPISSAQKKVKPACYIRNSPILHLRISIYVNRFEQILIKLCTSQQDPDQLLKFLQQETSVWKMKQKVIVIKKNQFQE